MIVSRTTTFAGEVAALLEKAATSPVCAWLRARFLTGRCLCTRQGRGPSRLLRAPATTQSQAAPALSMPFRLLQPQEARRARADGGHVLHLGVAALEQRPRSGDDARHAGRLLGGVLLTCSERLTPLVPGLARSRRSAVAIPRHA